jgi:hypothetical protein
MKNNPNYGKINIPSKDKDEGWEDDDANFDWGSFLGCDDDATQEDIDSAFDDQMC